MGRFSTWGSLGFTGNPYSVYSLPSDETGAALLTGRSTELRRLQLAIGAGGPHAAIEGPAGVGKTSLAMVAAGMMSPESRLQTEAMAEIFIPLPRPLQLGESVEGFSRNLLLGIAGALTENVDIFRRRGLQAPDLNGLHAWLNQPTIAASGTFTAMGIGAGAGRSINTSSGFSDQGLKAMVERALTQAFPSEGTGAIVAILDNLEIQARKSSVRASLEELRHLAFELPALRWVLIGTEGSITHARSRRLDGYISRPIRLHSLTDVQAEELMAKRLDYWGVGDYTAPVSPSDFRLVYSFINQNLRDALALSHDFSLDLLSSSAKSCTLPTAIERSQMFQSWLRREARNIVGSLIGLTNEAWGSLEALSRSAETVEVFEIDEGTMRSLDPLVQNGLVDLERDASRPHIRLAMITTRGWLCTLERRNAKRSISSAKQNSEEVLGALHLNLPRRVTFRDVCEIPDSPKRVVKLWKERTHGLHAPFGLYASRSGICPLGLDFISPNLFVHGATGAGKSSLLRTIAASLVLNNPPERVQLSLFERKGGATFSDIASTPHVLTHCLDEALDAQRLMEQITETLRECSGLSRSASGNASSHFCIVDEASVLVGDLSSAETEELFRWHNPNVHIILASQQVPKFSLDSVRHSWSAISLRSWTRLDSLQVLGTPDAAMVPLRVGRCFVRAAGDNLPVPAQISYLTNIDSESIVSLVNMATDGR